ncbi:hypothetical protein FXO37_28481 [Capsicum annuum]|nr:hypothetical protein FXO37_28481 [Capsicum annuum]
MEKYKSLKILQKSPNSGVCFLYLNRPSHLNAVSRDFLTEFPKAISSLGQNPDVAVIIFAGSGIDFQTLDNALKGSYAADCGRNVERLRLHMKFLQEAITALECCRKPVIAAVHGACIGGAIDIITACDIRFCSSDAFFSVKEVDLAITADLGTLQRLPVLLGLKMPWSWLLLVGGLQVPKLKTWAWSLSSSSYGVTSARDVSHYEERQRKYPSRQQVLPREASLELKTMETPTCKRYGLSGSLTPVTWRMAHGAWRKPQGTNWSSKFVRLLRPNNEEQTEDVVVTKQASMTVSSHDRLQRVDNSPR